MDFANDDDFGSSWWSNWRVKQPWIYVTLGREKAFNMVVITEAGDPQIEEYTLEYRANGVWKPLLEGNSNSRVKIHRFDTVWGDAVRFNVVKAKGPVSVAEFGVYYERK